MDVAAIDVPAIGTFVVTATGKNAHRTSLSVPERLSISKSNRDLIVSRMNSGRSARRLRFLIGFRVCAAWALQLFLPGSSRQRTISVHPRTGACTAVHASPAAPRRWYRCLRFSAIISRLAFSTESAFSERPISRPTLTARSMNVSEACRYFSTSSSFGPSFARHCETSE